MDYLTSARLLDLGIVNIEENFQNSGLYRFGWPQGKTEEKPKER